MGTVPIMTGAAFNIQKYRIISHGFGNLFPNRPARYSLQLILNFIKSDLHQVLGQQERAVVGLAALCFDVRLVAFRIKVC